MVSTVSKENLSQSGRVSCTATRGKGLILFPFPFHKNQNAGQNVLISPPLYCFSGSWPVFILFFFTGTGQRWSRSRLKVITQSNQAKLPLSASKTLTIQITIITANTLLCKLSSEKVVTSQIIISLPVDRYLKSIGATQLLQSLRLAATLLKHLKISHFNCICTYTFK